MPLYQYHCRKCGTEFEEFVLGGETPRCPRCSSARELERLITGACAVRSGRAAADGSGGAGASGGGSACSGCAGGRCSTCGR